MSILYKRYHDAQAEVDRQQKYGKIALVITLVFGLLLGALTMLLTYFVPVDELIDTDILRV